jgi:hypothetical protein
LGYYWNALGMSSATSRIVIYRWETDGSVTAPDGASLVGHLTAGQAGCWDGFCIRMEWQHFSADAAMVVVGPDIWYYYMNYWPYFINSAATDLLVENYNQYYVWQETCRETPGDSRATFFNWNEYPLFNAIPQDTVFLRSGLPIPRGSNVIKATVVLEGNSDYMVPGDSFLQPVCENGCDGKLVVRTQLVDHANVWWGLWGGPINGLPFLSTYSDSEISNPRFIDEVEIDVTDAVQAFVDRPDWQPYGARALFRFQRANHSDPDKFVFNRGMCWNWWQCAPRIRLTYSAPGTRTRSERSVPASTLSKSEHQPQVTLLSPTGGEKLPVSRPVTVKFASEYASTHVISVSTDGGKTFPVEDSVSRVDFPRQEAQWVPMSKLTSGTKAIVRVLAFNEQGEFARALSQEIEFIN